MYIYAVDQENLFQTNLGVYITDLPSPEKWLGSNMSTSFHQCELFSENSAFNKCSEIIRENPKKNKGALPLGHDSELLKGQKKMTLRCRELTNYDNKGDKVRTSWKSVEKRRTCLYFLLLK